ncbi:lysozyme inhibitor LprI family protein [Thiohalobacter thiocyanaticus]|uniref:DUF1311 domain-containing protein n=1 Tax=Thiohalobacter thiocyanaticus TaxID=585455 RepID=A0A426QKD1_9GAMM|nr:lysozyme inhibitor LprI family protein [Thiohalobacter thiocyanaticus]RRQ22221.1 DUF1311 domain-containing protein [Thiohalobacter thiocyanaticus]
MLEKIGFTVLGIVLSIVVYMFKRRIEGKPEVEALDKRKQLLDINKQLNEQGLTIEDLNKLEAILTGKAESIIKHTQEIEKNTQSLIEKEQGEFLSQAELNIRADSNLKVAKAQLEQIVNELTFKIDEIEREKLMQSQKAWESYSVEQAEAASISYRGGSIYPLIYLSELESLYSRACS